MVLGRIPAYDTTHTFETGQREKVLESTKNVQWDNSQNTTSSNEMLGMWGGSGDVDNCPSYGKTPCASEKV